MQVNDAIFGTDMVDIKDQDFEGTFPFTPHFIKINGFNMHFVDEGYGETVLMLYVNPTWGYL